MRVYCITGMHRSGTSLVARLAAISGVYLGPDSALLRAESDNPKGFWEAASIKTINERVFELLDASWDQPPPFLMAGWESSPGLNELRKQAHQVLTDLFGDEEIVGWKDPRTSLTLPFWRTVVPVTGTVLCLRRPADVVASLAVRNGLPSDQSLTLWLRYTVSAWLEDPDHLTVRYDEALKDPARIVRDIAAFVGADEPGPQQVEEAAEFADPGLDHSGEAVASSELLELAELVYHLIDTRTPAAVAVARLLRDRWSHPRGAALIETLRRFLPGHDVTRATPWSVPMLDELKGEMETVRRENTSMELTVRQADKSRLAAERQVRSLERHSAVLDQRLKDTSAELRKLKDESRTELASVKEQLAKSLVSLEHATAGMESAERLATVPRQELADVKTRYAMERATRKKLETTLKAQRLRYDRLANRRLVKLALALARPLEPVFRLVRRGSLRGP